MHRSAEAVARQVFSKPFWGLRDASYSSLCVAARQARLALAEAEEQVDAAKRAVERNAQELQTALAPHRRIMDEQQAEIERLTRAHPRLAPFAPPTPIADLTARAAERDWQLADFVVRDAAAELPALVLTTVVRYAGMFRTLAEVLEAATLLGLSDEWARFEFVCEQSAHIVRKAHHRTLGMHLGMSGLDLDELLARAAVVTGGSFQANLLSGLQASIDERGTEAHWAHCDLDLYVAVSKSEWEQRDTQPIAILEKLTAARARDPTSHFRVAFDRAGDAHARMAPHYTAFEGLVRTYRMPLLHPAGKMSPEAKGEDAAEGRWISDHYLGMLGVEINVVAFDDASLGASSSARRLALLRRVARYADLSVTRCMYAPRLPVERSAAFSASVLGSCDLYLNSFDLIFAPAHLTPAAAANVSCAQSLTSRREGKEKAGAGDALGNLEPGEGARQMLAYAREALQLAHDVVHTRATVAFTPSLYRSCVRALKYTLRGWTVHHEPRASALRRLLALNGIAMEERPEQGLAQDAPADLQPSNRVQVVDMRPANAVFCKDQTCYINLMLGVAHAHTRRHDYHVDGSGRAPRALDQDAGTCLYRSSIRSALA